MADIVGKEQVILNLETVQVELHQRIAKGIATVGEKALHQAERDVPQRKVFRYGRTAEGLRFESRQSVRTLTPGEVNRESGRRGAGVGYRGQGQTPSIQSTYFPEFGYRSRNRANTGNASLERRAIHVVPVKIKTGIGTGKTVGERHLPSREDELDLNAQGRYELRRKDANGQYVHRDQLGGNLRRSLRGFSRQRGRKIEYIVQAGGEKAPYAKYVEFGTRHAKAQPFLRPALAQARTELVRTVLASLGKSSK